MIRFKTIHSFLRRLKEDNARDFSNLISLLGINSTSSGSMGVNVMNYGAVGDGVIDDTAAFTTAIATGMDVYVPKGTFKITAALTLNIGQSIFGSGWNSIIRSYSTVRGINIATNSTIYNLQLVGNGKTSNNPFETGINCSAAVGWTIRGCKITGFGGDAVANGGGGIFVVTLGPGNTDGGRILDCYITGNKTGMNFADRGEYVTSTNLTITNNTIGIRTSAGNLSFSSCNIQVNTTGIKSETGVNDGHSTFNGCLVNHNTTNLDSNGIVNGNSFNGCMFYSGNIIFTSNKGLRFINCDFCAGSSGSNSITLTSNTSIQFANCRYPKNPTAGYMAVTLVSGNAITEVNNLDF